MKYLFALLTLLVIGCEEKDGPNTRVQPYPGKYYWSECGALYDSSWLKTKEDVVSCEDGLAKPKFKIGERVRIEYYDKSCKSRVVSNKRWNSKTKMVHYKVSTTCGELSGYAELDENQLKKVK